ncbi:MAG TPA: alpha-isopropylmalate synthase regulatory domain-containing protein, partial [Kofleriaceae bacterium]|nr:alpha-isopropylmalate synthase regulatory domain-containing protein [Kofleriaceae bacterium]
HSGRAALAARLAELGAPVAGAALDRVFARFKALADHRKQVTDADLEALIGDELPAVPGGDAFALDGLQVACGTIGMPTATVRLRRAGGAVTTRAAVGTGPVDAAYKAIDAIVGHTGADGRGSELLEYTVHAVTEGIDALGHVSVRVREPAAHGAVTPLGEAPRPRVFHGAGADTDIVVASAKAYLRAINRMLAAPAGAHAAPAAYAVPVAPAMAARSQLERSQP